MSFFKIYSWSFLSYILTKVTQKLTKFSLKVGIEEKLREKVICQRFFVKVVMVEKNQLII
jgi:hypothetical protein